MKELTLLQSFVLIIFPLVLILFIGLLFLVIYGPSFFICKKKYKVISSIKQDVIFILISSILFAEIILKLIIEKKLNEIIPVVLFKNIIRFSRMSLAIIVVILFLIWIYKSLFKISKIENKILKIAVVSTNSLVLTFLFIFISYNRIIFTLIYPIIFTDMILFLYKKISKKQEVNKYILYITTSIVFLYIIFALNIYML